MISLISKVYKGEFGTGNPVDVGNFPMIAMQRMELLKNGGAVTYGSDAITGVLNFITRKGFEGFEVKANFSDKVLKGWQK